MESDNFVVIQGWMCNELNLKGYDLLVFALIHGFSQDKESVFMGSRKYIANTFNISLPTVDKTLKSLVDKELIEQIKHEQNGVIFNRYKTLPGVKKLYRAGKETLSNNINNKIVNSVYKSKDLYTSDHGKKSNLYSNCISLIDNFIMEHISANNQSDIRKLLVQHLNIALEQKRIRGRLQYKGILDKLYKIQQDTNAGYENIIFYSIEKGYPTFYEPPKRKSVNAVATESGKRHVESFTEDDKREQDRFIKQLKKEGKKYVF